jgi:hypothetical protein
MEGIWLDIALVLLTLGLLANTFSIYWHNKTLNNLITTIEQMQNGQTFRR